MNLRRAFTLLELTAVIAIISFLVVGGYFFTMSYVSSTQTVSTNLVIDSLNKALAQYRTYGGPQNSYTLGAANSTAKITNVIAAMKAGMTFNGELVRFLPPNTTIQTSGITGTGSAANYLFAPTGSSITTTSVPQATVIATPYLYFGTIAVGSSATATLTIQNTSSSTLTVSSVAAVTYPSNYTVSWSSGTIAAGASQSVTVTFAPGAVQAYSDSISIVSNAANGTVTTALSGMGGSAIISLAGDMAFGAVTVGSTAVHSLTINNSGTLPLTVTSISLPTGYTTSWSSGTIAAGGFQNISITFSPISVTTYNGTLTVASNAASGTNTISLTGSGTQGTIALSSSLGSPMAFGTVCINTTATGTLTITNNGGNPLAVSAISLPSGYTADWTSGTIAPGGIRNVTVSFTPLVNGTAYNGTITVTSNAASGTNTLSVTGTGGEPQISLSPSPMSFPNTGASLSSKVTLTISNPGTTALHVTSITYPSTYSGAFSGTVAAGGTQNVTVTFSPLAEATYSGTITVNSDSLSGTNTDSVSGNGEDVTTNMKMYYSMASSDISGSSITDLSGNGNTGTLNGSPPNVSGTLSFDGSTQTISLSGVPTTATDNLTIAGWFYWVGAPTSASFFTENGGANGYGMLIGNGSCGTGSSLNILVGYVTCNALNSTAYTLPSDTWTHLVIERSGGTWYLYANGSLQITGGSSSPNGPTGPTSICTGFQGFANETRIYSRALSVGEISALYNITPVAAPPAISLSGSMTFGNVPVNNTSSSTLTITNPGGTTLNVTSISLPTGYTSSWSSGTIAPGGTQNATITFAPTAAQTYNGTITVNSNSDNGVSTLSATGTGKNISANLMLYYSMDNSTISGSSISDLSGNGNTGTIYNSPSSVSGKYSQALLFNGTNNYINIPDSTSIRMANINTVTVCAWVKTTSSSGGEILARGGNCVDYGVYSLSLTAAGKAAITFVNAFSGPGQHSVIGATSLNDGQWHYVAGVLNGTVITLYVDAVADGSRSDFSGNIYNDNGSSYELVGGLYSTSGCGGTPAAPLGATIDEVRAYNIALSTTNIQNIYNAGSPP